MAQQSTAQSPRNLVSPGEGGRGGEVREAGLSKRRPETSSDLSRCVPRHYERPASAVSTHREAANCSGCFLSIGRTEKPLPPVGASLCLVARHSVVSAKATHARYRVGRGSAKTKATRLGLSPLPSTTSTEKLSAHAFHACFLDGVWKRVHPPPDYARVASRKQQIESPANTGQLGELSG